MEQGLFEDAVGEPITAIKPLPSDPNLRSIRIGRQTVARLRACDVESLDLEVGQTWTAALARAVHGAVSRDKARRAALKMLGRRAYATADLTDRLSRKGHDPDTVRSVIDELVTDGWMDDEAFAQSLAHELTARQPAAAAFIRQRLEQRGIAAELAERVADAARAGVDSVDEAVRMAHARLEAMGPVSGEKRARRIAGWLQRRGYDQDTVHTALQQVGLLDQEQVIDDAE